MIEEDLIRERLNDPDIEVKQIGEDEKGAFASVIVTGTESKLIRLTRENFDIDGKPKGMMDDGVRARLRPKW